MSMIQRCWTILLLGVALPASAQSGPGDQHVEPDSLYYVTGMKTTLFRDANGTQPYLRLGFREPVVANGAHGTMLQVRTEDGARGYVQSESVSNLWILVSKRRKRLELYQGMRLVMGFPADFGYNAYSDKIKRGSEAERDHWRTPEGVYYVVRKNPWSQYYKAFLLNYPNQLDADRGLRSQLINQAEHDAIMRAESRGQAPPMNTMLGGMIEIHGNGTGLNTNWTQGCVAVRDAEMDQMWDLVQVGTPVVIEK